MSSNCCATSECSGAGEIKVDILFRIVGVRFVSNDRSGFEVMFWRRRRDVPFQSGGAPGVGAGNAPAFQRPQKINQRHNIADTENGSSGGREDMEHLEIGRISMVPTWHSEIA